MKMTTAFGMTTRVALLALCTMTVGSVSMMAQDNSAPAAQQDDQAGMGGGRGHRGGDQAAFLTKKLNLTPDQASQVKAIDNDSRQQSMAVRNDSSVAPADKKAKMMDIRKASQDKIRGVLTDEQKPKYDAMLAQMQERRQDRQGGQQGAPAPAPQQ